MEIDCILLLCDVWIVQYFELSHAKSYILFKCRCYCGVTLNIFLCIEIIAESENRHNNYSKQLFSLNSSVMDDNHDTYKTVNIKINQFFETLD